MKTHTKGEKHEAMQKLPEPLYDFLVSQTLSNIYLGLQKKHSLDLRQLAILADITNTTLMGLEPESALETNLHQGIHELSNQGARELVADINDRIFKEAKRRLAEGIEESSVWSEERKHPEPEPSEEERARLAELDKIINLDDEDPELLAAIARDEEAERKHREEADRELAAALEEAKNDPPETDVPLEELEYPEIKEAEREAPAASAPTSGIRNIPVPGRTIAEENLGLPEEPILKPKLREEEPAGRIAQSAAGAPAPMPYGPRVPRFKEPGVGDEPIARAMPSSPGSPSTAAAPEANAPKKTYGGSDPYREPPAP